VQYLLPQSHFDLDLASYSCDVERKVLKDVELQNIEQEQSVMVVMKYQCKSITFKK
jgi:hypothetical protein